MRRSSPLLVATYPCRLANDLAGSVTTFGFLLSSRRLHVPAVLFLAGQEIEHEHTHANLKLITHLRDGSHIVTSLSLMTSRALAAC
jgi:hypothetical protein